MPKKQSKKKVEPLDLNDTFIRGVSFDLSKTRTGVATWNNQNPTGVFHREYKDATDTGHLMMKWRHDLADIIPPYGIGWVAIEDVRPVNKNHSEIHFAMLGVLAEICYRRNIPMLRVTATQVKKRLFGKGKATKEEMVEAARNLYPFLNVRNDDEADAVGVGLCAIDMIDWKDPQPTQNFDRTPF